MSPTWSFWLLGFVLAIATTVALSLRAGRGAVLAATPLAPAASGKGSPPSRAAAAMRPAWLEPVAEALLAVPFALGILVVLEFVKDDAYISFRYAHNLVTGNGLVFNHGERLEGFTNFLWVFILAPFEALGWDLFQVCEVLGTALGVACLVFTARMTAWVQGEREDFAHLWGALWLSTSSSFVLWAKGGLEQPLASFLPIASALVLWPARERLAGSAAESERRRIEARYLGAGLLMGAACITRPELHLMALLVAVPLGLDVVRSRRIRRAEWLYVAGVLAITIPCHAFRYAYYGTLIPNTFYVKTSTGSVWRQGLESVREMFGFNFTGALVVLSPLAFIDRQRRAEKGAMAVIVVAFLVYYVAVGADEMQWHRLFLPALPFLCVMASLGAENAIDLVYAGLCKVLRKPVARTKTDRRALARKEVKGRGDTPTDTPTYRRWMTAGLGWAAVLFAAYTNFAFTYKEWHGFDGHGDLAGTFHPDMGKFLVRHERPGGLVAFQDVGSTPYHAPDLDFLDFIGLVDATVAHARHDFGLHAFAGNNAPAAQARFDEEMREYFFRRNPEWAILTIYGNSSSASELQRTFDKDPTGASFGNAYFNNPYQFGLWGDPRFAARYVPVRTWPRSSEYYLALWRRRDLWEKTPREVVLDAVPEGLGGAKATLEGGLELLGSDVTPRTIERHEAFITTWWRLPGPLPRDTYFFVHVVGHRVQVPADHVPGDWMYPADRWTSGQILEDRTLFQLPPFVMRPGRYDVYVGAYERSTGRRLKVLAGNAGQDRIFLGSFEARPLLPLIDQLIPPTRVDVMRRYPDRIVDPHASEAPRAMFR
jgi:hypothetical protein